MRRLKDPKSRVKGAWVILACSLIGWPVSIFTFAKDEPVSVLSLSWLALSLTALDILATTDTRQNQEGD